MKAILKKVTIPQNKRIICISDIHGSLYLLKQLLNKINYTEDDILILLGDFYTKGKENHETFKFIVDIAENPNVHVLRGNCDWEEEYLSDVGKAWLNGLPHIIETKDYIFVHGGLTSSDLDEQDALTCMKNDAFMEKGLKFEKYVVTGHWPTVNYTHRIPCFNPIVNEENRIISIDGGIVLKDGGQLNAFIICDSNFSYDFVDDLPIIKIEKNQSESGGNLNITWFDRFVELLEDGEEFSLYRHIQSGNTIFLPKISVWTDNNGNLCACNNGTDYYLPINIGDTVSIINRFSSRILAKKNGTVGWINT